MVDHFWLQNIKNTQANLNIKTCWKAQGKNEISNSLILIRNRRCRVQAAQLQITRKKSKGLRSSHWGETADKAYLFCSQFTSAPHDSAMHDDCGQKEWTTWGQKTGKMQWNAHIVKNWLNFVYIKRTVQQFTFKFIQWVWKKNQYILLNRCLTRIQYNRDRDLSC